jgi:hypothetical protein
MTETTPDFPVSTDDIVVNPESENWGPFSFDVTEGIPDGDSVASATVTSTHLATGLDSTADLIASGSISVAGNAVNVSFDYPGDAFVGVHSLLFDVVLASGPQQGFTFVYVTVEGPS